MEARIVGICYPMAPDISHLLWCGNPSLALVPVKRALFRYSCSRTLSRCLNAPDCSTTTKQMFQTPCACVRETCEWLGDFTVNLLWWPALLGATRPLIPASSSLIIQLACFYLRAPHGDAATAAERRSALPGKANQICCMT